MMNFQYSVVAQECLKKWYYVEQSFNILSSDKLKRDPVILVKVFKNWPSKICERQPLNNLKCKAGKTLSI